MKRIEVKGENIQTSTSDCLYCYTMTITFHDNQKPEKAFTFRVDAQEQRELLELQNILKILMFFQKDMPLN